MKWQQALKDYLSYLRIERGLSENSISNYALDIKKLITWLDDSKIHTTAIAIKPEVIQEFIYTIAKEVNPRSQSRIISGLKGFFILYSDRGLVKEKLGDLKGACSDMQVALLLKGNESINWIDNWLSKKCN